MPQRIIIGEGGVEGLVIELVFHGAYLGKGGGGGGGAGLERQNAQGAAE